MNAQGLKYYIDFDKELTRADSKDGKERIGRQINVANPIRAVWPLTRLNDCEGKIRSGDMTPVIKRGSVLDEVRNDYERAEVLNVVGKLRYGADNMLMSDLGAAINSNLTNPKSRAEFYNVTNWTDDGKIVKTSVTMSREGAVKMALGPLVDGNGRALSGAGPVVKECRKRLIDLLTEKRPPPRAMTTMSLGGELMCAMAAPVRMADVGLSDKRAMYQIELDRRFFPVQEREEGGYKTKGLYVHQVAGLYTVLSFGRHLMRQRKLLDGTNGPDSPGAHKTVLYIQAAMEMATFAPGLIRKRSNGRYDLRFRQRSTVEALRPSAVEKDRPYWRCRWGEVSKYIASVGRMYKTAIDELGILEKLDDRVLIPAIERGAEFIPENDEIFYIKAQNVKSNNIKCLQKKTL